MDRREFLAVLGISGGIAAAGAALNYAIEGENMFLGEKGLERKLLEDFLYSERTLQREEIANVLVDITKKTEEGGRFRIGSAFHIGDGYLLTNFHVIDGDNMLDLMANISYRAGYLIGSAPFDVLQTDRENDLALLRWRSSQRRGKALIGLSKKVIEENASVSFFEYVFRTQASFEKTITQELTGQDIYRRGRQMNLGSVVLPSKSPLLETQGFVVPYRPEMFEPKQRSTLPKSSFFMSTLQIYNGSSGGPVFLRLPGNHYALVGVQSKLLGFDFDIPTPKHPLKYKTMQQVATYSLRGKPVENLIRTYLAKASR